MGPEVITQNADAVIARLADSYADVRALALGTLGTLEPAALASHAGAVVGALEDDDHEVRWEALDVLGKLEPDTLAQHTDAVAARLDDSDSEADVDVRGKALETLRKLPRFVTRGVDFEALALRSRLLGRLAWYRCRLRLRVERLAWYWYALPYRPSGPGHARDVAAWDQMNKRSRLV